MNTWSSQTSESPLSSGPHPKPSQVLPEPIGGPPLDVNDNNPARRRAARNSSSLGTSGLIVSVHDAQQQLAAVSKISQKEFSLVMADKVLQGDFDSFESDGEY